MAGGPRAGRFRPAAAARRPQVSELWGDVTGEADAGIRGLAAGAERSWVARNRVGPYTASGRVPPARGRTGARVPFPRKEPS